MSDAALLAFHNTLTRKIEPFVPHAPNVVKIYTCGPTVYDFAHIGNFRSYIIEDLLRRVLKFAGFQVIQVMNITDIDDKIIKASQKEGIALEEFTKRYSDAFFEDIEKLNIECAEYYPKATDHVPEMTAIIKDLLKKGAAYRGDDGSYYFSISAFPDYGRLAHLNMDELMVGVRIKLDEYDKEKASDFALWKAWDEQDGPVFWETDLGKGRPGWHIECSAMSLKYLGEELDIHMGGVDNIFPHHENEIAQSEVHTGKKFVKYWVHCEHLLVDHRKMSKSLGNFYTLRDLVKMGHSPLALRYLYISTHYRSKLNFTLEGLKAAENTIAGLRDFIERLRLLPSGPSSGHALSELVRATRNEFTKRLFDDLNTPQALASLFSLITEVNKLIDESRISREEGEKVQQLLFELDRVLGLNLASLSADDSLAPDETRLVEERETARRKRDFKRADEIRDLLKSRGIILKDTPTGVVWKKTETT
jgi:cysteinyl-tRNA synthetase